MIVLTFTYNWALAVTLLGLLFSLITIFSSSHGNTLIAVISLMCSGLCDLFDGFIARTITQSENEKKFGVQIDSLVDMASFGIVPVVMMINMHYSNLFCFISYCFYSLCAALRLAHFNSHANIEKRDTSYTGLPVTYSALIFPLLLTIKLIFSDSFPSWLIPLSFCIVGVFFILNIKIAKPRGIFYILFPFIFILISFIWLIKG